MQVLKFGIFNYFVICALSFVINSSCAQEGKTKAQPLQPKEIPAAQTASEETRDLAQAPDEMLSSFSVSGFTKGGEKQWDLAGKSADIMVQMIKLLAVSGKVYGKDVNLTIVADEGSLDRTTNRVHLEKNVCATTDDGAELTTDYLDWDAANQRLSSDAPVWLERGMMEARGVGMIAQPALNLVQLNKDVTVNLTLAQQQDVSQQPQVAEDKRQSGLPAQTSIPPTVITCSGPLEVEYGKNLATFHEHVIVTDNRGKIYADKMDVYFSAQDDESKQLQGIEGMGIDKVVAMGNVEIHRSSNITYSQEAVYDTATGKLTLTGEPKLVIYSTEDFGRMMGTSEGAKKDKVE